MAWAAEIRSAAAESPWRTVEGARRAGYVPMGSDVGHWYSRAALLDGRLFDAEHPEFIVVHNGRVVGVMFVGLDSSLDQPDPPGAPLARWHYHQWQRPVCMEAGMVAVSDTEGGSCPSGQTVATRSPLMVHVWLGTRGDEFASDMNPR